MSADREASIVERLAALAAVELGFSEQAISIDGIRRMVHAELKQGRTAEELARAAASSEPWLMKRMHEAVLVGETFFFRQPEHFQVLAARTLIERVSSHSKPLRLWSAGCSSGEEAYSLAACALAVLPEGLGQGVEVLGTDISERQLALATKGIYSNWSRRESGPVLYPVFRSHPDGRVEVLEKVRSATRFVEHNLLQSAESLGSFDVIFCRNVLVYLTAEAAGQVLSHLRRALTPSGVLFLGTLDVEGPIPGLVRLGPAPLQMFTPPPPPPATPATPEEEPAHDHEPEQREARELEQWVTLHLTALSLIERGQYREARQTLLRLHERAPGYLPATLELALLQGRFGNPDADALMREVLQGACALDDEHMVPGPEPLPARFYQASAEAFLQGRERGP